MYIVISTGPLPLFAQSRQINGTFPLLAFDPHAASAIFGDVVNHGEPRPTHFLGPTAELVKDRSQGVGFDAEPSRSGPGLGLWQGIPNFHVDIL